MKESLQILVLEDVPADVVLINHQLRQARLQFRTRRVETKADFVRELHRQPPDLILSDHGLPEFDGFTALTLAQDQCPDVPFIFVTSSMGEETAVETLKSGATDYVLKERLDHLVPAVTRALRLAEERRKRREAERALAESEERFRMLVEGMRDYAIVMLDPDGRVAAWNAGAERILGYRAEEVIGSHVSRFYPPEAAEAGRLDRVLREATSQGPQEEEVQQMRKGGARFWASVVLTALRDHTGRLRGFATVIRDITDRRRASLALQRTEARKSAILEAAFDAILSIDGQGTILDWNPAAERMFDHPRAEAVGKKMDDLIVPPSLRVTYQHGLADYLTTGVGSLLDRPIEMTAIRASGGEFPVEVGITRLEGGGEEPSFTIFVRDITARRQAEQALRQDEERFRRMVEGVKDYAIYMLDAKGRVATWNNGAQRIKGYHEEEIIGRPLETFFTREDVRRGAPKQLLEQAASAGQAVYEGWRVRKDGSRFWVEGTLTALRDEAGQLYGYCKVAHDITRQKEAEAAIRTLNEQLEQRVRERTAQLEAANHELEAFTYSVSHDLRTPLRHVIGFVDMLQTQAAPGLADEQRRLLERIVESTQKMTRLINDLLDFSRLGRAELSKTTVDLKQITESVIAELGQESGQRKVDWELGPLPPVEADPALLRQVLINLLSNALKFTRPRAVARIEVAAQARPQEVICHVRDNGVGFDMRYVDKLFGVFQRLHRAADFEGTGIGLANVRSIIQRHGGRVWAEGLPQDGATFFFSLPKTNSRAEEGEL